MNIAEWPRIQSRAERERLWESTRMGQWWLRQVDRHHTALFGSPVKEENMTSEQRATRARLNALYDYRDEVMNSNRIPYEVPNGYSTERPNG